MTEKNPRAHWTYQVNSALKDVDELKVVISRENEAMYEKLRKIARVLLLAQTMRDPEPLTPAQLREEEEENAEVTDEVPDEVPDVEQVTELLGTATIADEAPATPQASIPADDDQEAPTSSGLYKMGNYGMEMTNWLEDFPEDKRIIQVPKLSDFEDNLYNDEGWQEYYEKVRDELIEGRDSNNRLACQLCIDLGLGDGLGKRGRGYLVRKNREGTNQCALMTHIQNDHKNKFRNPVKCGCDHRGRTTNIEGYTSFKDLRQHINGVQVLGDTRLYNIHYRARHAV